MFGKKTVTTQVEIPRAELEELLRARVSVPEHATYWWSRKRQCLVIKAVTKVDDCLFEEEER